MGSAPCTPSTKVAGGRSSASARGGRSRRSPSPSQPSMACRFSTWSLSKLGEFLVAEGVVDDISHEGLRVLLREEGVTFQRLKTWKASKDPDYAVKKARVEHLYAIADREVIPEPGEPEVIFCVDEFGPLNLQPHPGRQWAAISGKNVEPGAGPGPAAAPPTPAPAGGVTRSPPTSWAKTSCMGISSRARTGPGSWSSAGTCAPSTR